LLEISETADQHELENRLIHLNYRSISKPDNPPPHLMFVKGYTDSGFRGQAYHLHVRYYGDWDEPFFRDYLILHPAIAHEYEILKLHLVALYKNDRDAYTYGKTDFIKRITKLAREEKDQR
jgi:GrpB-like predicted nucleotidyltransferase (UPF0157 family)